MFTESENFLVASFRFADFTKAISFMIEVAFVCEKMDHHPEWTNVWNRVDIKLNTHSAGHTVTAKDRLLAQEIEKIYLARK
jgi:4a-hydroxytetrahydrobiopterin dehydratase